MAASVRTLVVSWKDAADKKESVFSMDEYIELLIECIRLLPPDMVIHRISGDGPKKLLVAPEWSGNKRAFLNTFSKALRESGCFQGQDFTN